MQPKTDPQVKMFVTKVAVVFILTAIASWSVQLGTIHSDTPLIGGQWFTTLIWIVRGLSVVSGISVVAVFADKTATSINKFLKGRQQVTNAKLKNDKLKQEVALIPQVIQNGIERGFNVDYGGAKVSNPIERINERVNYNQPKDQIGEEPPEPFTLSDVLSDYEPSDKGIVLSKGNSGLVTVPLGDRMCHVALASKTGGGKTNAQRIIATQLLASDQDVYFCDPTWQDIRVNNDGQRFDYRPIRNRLAEPPATTPEAATDVMRRLVEETQKRMRVAENRVVRLPRKYVIADELPYFAQYSKEFMGYVATIVRIGRNYGIYLIVAAQDFQNNTLNVEGGAFRSNFLTNYFGNGDLTTARLLLRFERGEKPDLHKVGSNGVFLLNAQGYSNSRIKVRVPLGDNESVYQLLGSRPDIPVNDEVVYDMEPLIQVEPVRTMSDLDKVRAACAEIEGRGEKPSRRNIAEVTGFGASKAGDLLKELKVS